MSIPTPSPSTRFPLLILALIAFGSLPYGVMMGGFDDLHDVDGISRGLAAIYALVAIVILWILLAIALVNAASAGAMPGWAGVVALVLHPLSFAAMIVALMLLSGDDYGWIIAAPAALPPLIAIYALWARLPKLHAVLPPGPTGAALWGLVLLLSLAPIAAIVQREATREAQHRQIPYVSEEAQRARQQAQEREEHRARFAELTAASPLDEYLQFLRPGDELRDRALAALRGLDSRQTQAEAMLRQDVGLDVVRNLPVLELQPTPSLCRVANDYLLRRLANDGPKGSDPTFWTAEDDLEALLPGLRWLAGQRCDVAEALAAAEAMVRAYPEAAYANNRLLVERRRIALDDLAGLRAMAGH